MEKKNNIRNIRILIFILAIIVICLIAVIFVFMDSENDENNVSEYNDLNENNNLSNTTNEIISNTSNSNNTTNSTTATVTQNYNTQTLKTDNTLFSYFLIKYCLNVYYGMDSIDNMINIIDTEAIDEVDLSIFNYNIKFCIDNFYVQKLDANLYGCLVYYRYNSAGGDSVQSVMLIKIDTNNESFSIYPYEYLSQHGYTNLTEGDRININNLNGIDNNEYNTYMTNYIETNSEICAEEIFAKYKFDLYYDIEHLYNSLNEEYKELKFPKMENLEQFIEDNITDLKLESMADSEITEEDEGVRIKITGNRGRVYYFDATSMVDYTSYLDNYTIVLDEDLYESYLYQNRAKYCIVRIIQAINDKDYSFVYENLNPIQKNNYYRTQEELEEFIKNTFYEKNSYEFSEDYVNVGTGVYKYEVTIIDTYNESNSFAINMTVTVEEGTDFVVSITEV